MIFTDFARTEGLDIDPNQFYASDRIHRCPTIDKPRSKNGAWFWDGQRGWAMNWSTGGRTVWYNDPNAKPWTPEEKALWAAKRSESASEQEKKYAQAADEANRLLKLSNIEKHAYLQWKGFSDQKGFVLDEKLLIPMRNVVTNKLQGIQSIYYDSELRKYEKKMLYGMRAKNAVYWIGDMHSKEIYLCEGLATGLSIKHALKMCGIKASVCVCFSSGNLICVADQIQGNRFIFADNDASKTGQKAAEATGLPWTMADTEGFDANDIEMNESVFSVVKKIMELRNKFLNK
jgi:putative DNA primase/helicase